MATQIPIPDELRSAMCEHMIAKEAEPPIPLTDPSFQRTYTCLVHRQTMYFDDLGYTGLMMIGRDKWEIRLDYETFERSWVKSTRP